MLQIYIKIIMFLNFLKEICFHKLKKIYCFIIIYNNYKNNLKFTIIIFYQRKFKINRI